MGYVDEIRRLETELKSFSRVYRGKIGLNKKEEEEKRKRERKTREEAQTLVPRSLLLIKLNLKRMHLGKGLKPFVNPLLQRGCFTAFKRSVGDRRLRILAFGIGR